MAAAITLSRLKVTQLINTYRTSVSAALGDGLILAFGLLAVMGFGIVFWEEGVSQAHTEESFINVVLIGSVLCLAWLVTPFFVTSSLMNPRLFVPYPMRPSQLMPALLLSSHITPAALITLLYLLLHPLLFRTSAAGVVMTVLLVPLLMVYVNLLHQACTAAVACWFSARVWRVVFSVTLICLLIAGYPLVLLLQQLVDDAGQLLQQGAQWLSWTPLGAGFALPYDAAAGDWGAVAARVLILAATAGIAAGVLLAGLKQLMDRPPAASASGRRRARGDLGLFTLLPGTPTGAVAARSLTYWLTDPRYGFKLIVLPFVMFGLIALHLATGAGWPIYIMGPYVAFLMGFVLIADLAMDYTGFSLHVTAGIHGAADRWGRTIASMILGVPLVAAAGFVPVVVIDGVAAAAVTATLSVSLFCTVLGVSAWFAARWVFPVVKPGESPLKSPPGSGGRAAMVQGFGLLILGAVFLPETVLLVSWALAGHWWWAWATVLISVPKAAAALYIGHRLGARRYDRSLPEIYQKIAAS